MLEAELIWAYARSGAFQRSWIYSQTANEEDKKTFRNEVKNFLFVNVFIRYRGQKITESKLLGLIESLTQLFKGKSYLREKKLKFGNAQKFVNLYLKGMWVAGYLKTPPHFPVDRIMINKLGLNYNWTNMNKQQYQQVITNAKKRILPPITSLAELEAHEYQIGYINETKETL